MSATGNEKGTGFGNDLIPFCRDRRDTRDEKDAVDRMDGSAAYRPLVDGSDWGLGSGRRFFQRR